jgi:hypothetical protein
MAIRVTATIRRSGTPAIAAASSTVRRTGVIAPRGREPTPAASGFLALPRREWPRRN